LKVLVDNRARTTTYYIEYTRTRAETQQENIGGKKLSSSEHAIMQIQDGAQSMNTLYILKF
jgi:hypothetical protein